MLNANLLVIVPSSVLQQEFVTTLFNFAMSLNTLSLNDTELALLTGVVLLTGERPGITDAKAIEHQQGRLIEALRVQVGPHGPS